MDVKPIGVVNYFALHHLCRLLLQIRVARDRGTFLVLSDDDQVVLDELAQFVLSKRIPTPYDLPDFRSRRVVASESAPSPASHLASP
jgi:hypothetical protein